jgi:hypothetical protein
VLYPDTAARPDHGSITIGARTFLLRPLNASANRNAIAEVITSSDSRDVSQSAPLVVWLDRDGIVTLVTNVPVDLIDSPTLYMRTVDSPLAISLPRSLVESTGISVGTRLRLTVPGG